MREDQVSDYQLYGVNYLL